MHEINFFIQQIIFNMLFSNFMNIEEVYNIYKQNC